MYKIELSNLPKLSHLVRGYFLSGVLVLLPLCVIAWILFYVIGILWGLQEWIPGAWQPEQLFQNPVVYLSVKLLLTILSGFSIVLLVSILGWASRLWLGQKILEFVAEIILRIPILRSVYSALDQLMRAFGSGNEQQFSRVVYLEYPRAEVWTLAFVTGQSRSKVPALKDHLNVYVPTTPNPTSGFFLMVPETQVVESGLSVEDAFKTILSLGIAQGP